MKKFILRVFTCTSFLLYCGSGFSQTDVLMQHNDLNRTGWNNTETILNQSNVTPTTFGILYHYNVDDQIFSQPLVVNNVTVTDPATGTSVIRNVVYVTTVNNTVYAFDAENGSLEPYWQKNFTPPGMLPPNTGDIHASLCEWHYPDFTGNFGIVGTPVIDKASNTIYLVSRYKNPALVDNTSHSEDQDWLSDGFYQQFHALSLSTGNDTLGSPVFINGDNTFVTGTGPGNVSGIIRFDPRRENQREGLVLVNGVVYIPYAGHCDMNYYHGWVLGYNSHDLSQQVVRFVTTPNGGRGGTWMSGAAPAVDADGNLYFATGNAEEGSDWSTAGNFALSVIKATPDITNHTLKPLAWFKPAKDNYDDYNDHDLDFGTGVLLVPNEDMLVTAHKSGNILVLKKSPVSGEYDETSSNLLQTINIGDNAGSHSSISYFGGATTQFVYQFSEYTNLQAFPVISGTGNLGTPIISTVPGQHAAVTGGGFMSVSSNGTDESSAILWINHITGNSIFGTLDAVKANDVRVKLWSSDDNLADTLGAFAKMNCVTVANGKVYAPAASNNLKVYGLLTDNSRCTENVALDKTASASSSQENDMTPNYAVDGNQGTRWAVATAPSAEIPQYLSVDLGVRFKICHVTIQWDNTNDYGVDFTVDVSEDGENWTTLNTVTGNSFPSGTTPVLNDFNENSSGRYVRVNISKGTGGFASISEFQVYGVATNNCIPPTVPSVPVTNITENSATLNWTGVSGITNYLVKYRPSAISSYITRNVTDASGAGGNQSLNISALSCGTGYNYTVQADCGGGSLSDSIAVGFLTTNCSSPCSNLTRWNHSDLGDIQVSGSSCYTDGISTVIGAGTGIGGNADQFQFDYTPLETDDEFIAQLASQDVVSPGNINQAGIMIRESLSDISRFIFVGKTPENKIYLLYRNTAAGSVSSFSTDYISGNNYFRIVKTGTLYSAYYGSSFTGPWTQLDVSHDLGFGNALVYKGFGVSSREASVTSTATFILPPNSTGLPIRLLDFTATNEQNKYVFLKWQTTMEENNDYFSIERSVDGINFNKIGTIKAAGNSSIIRSYSFVDENPPDGFVYYRFKQVDLDNHYSYSPVRLVKFGKDLSPVIQPNPVHDQCNIIAGTEPVKEVVIYNVQGRAVNFLINNSGGNDMTINVSSMAAGIYILKIKTEEKVYQIRMVKE